MKRKSQFRSLWLVATATWCLQSGVSHAGLLSKLIEGAPKRVELTESTDKAAAYKEAFGPKGNFGSAPGPVTNGNRKIVIAGFQVEFATEQKAIAKGNGAGAGLASTTDVVYTLKGVSEPQLQAVTDRLHAAFVSQLQARGYEVLPVSQLEATDYKEYLQKANQPPRRHERGAAIDLIITPTEKEVDNASVIVTAKDTAPDVFSRFMAGLGPGPRAADTLQANVAHVRLKVNFARFEETGWFNPDIDSKPQNILSPNGTFMQVFMPGGLHLNYPLTNTVVLPRRVANAANPVQATAEQTTQRAAGGAVRVLGGLLKGGIGGVADVAGGAVGAAHSVMASGNYEVVASENYESVVSQDTELGMSLLLEAFPQAPAQ